MTSVATEAWIGCALLQRDEPERSFSPKQIVERVKEEMEAGNLNYPLRPGVHACATYHNVANKKAASVKM